MLDDDELDVVIVDILVLLAVLMVDMLDVLVIVLVVVAVLADEVDDVVVMVDVDVVWQHGGGLSSQLPLSKSGQQSSNSLLFLPTLHPMSQRHQPCEYTLLLIATCASGRPHASPHCGFSMPYGGHTRQCVVVVVIVVVVVVVVAVVVLHLCTLIAAATRGLTNANRSWYCGY